MDLIGIDQTDFMISQLNRIGRISKKLDDNRNIRTLCCNPAHQDSDPSLFIRIDGKAAICWACKWTGSWNKIADILQLDPLPGSYKKGGEVDSDVLVKNLDHLLQPPTKKRILSLPRGTTPWDRGAYRGASQNLLAALDTRLWKDVKGSKHIERILWPFWVNQKLLGYSGRVLPEWEPPREPTDTQETYKARLKAFYNSGWPKYKNCHGSPVREVLWPYDSFDRLTTCVLVEGQTSALRLLAEGLCTQAILGAQNWSDDKKNLLLAKGVRNLIVLFDGDTAGRKATEEVSTSMDNFVNLHALDLPDDVDPGDMDEVWMAKVKALYKQLDK